MEKTAELSSSAKSHSTPPENGSTERSSSKLTDKFKLMTSRSRSRERRRSNSELPAGKVKVITEDKSGISTTRKQNSLTSRTNSLISTMVTYKLVSTNVDLPSAFPTTALPHSSTKRRANRNPKPRPSTASKLTLKSDTVKTSNTSTPWLSVNPQKFSMPTSTNKTETKLLHGAAANKDTPK